MSIKPVFCFYYCRFQVLFVACWPSSKVEASQNEIRALIFDGIDYYCDFNDNDCGLWANDTLIDKLSDAFSSYTDVSSISINSIPLNSSLYVKSFKSL